MFTVVVLVVSGENSRRCGRKVASTRFLIPSHDNSKNLPDKTNGNKCTWWSDEVAKFVCGQAAEVLPQPGSPDRGWQNS